MGRASDLIGESVVIARSIPLSGSSSVGATNPASPPVLESRVVEYSREAWPTPTVVVRESWSDGVDMVIAYTAVDTNHAGAVNTSLDGWEGDGLIINVTVVNRLSTSEDTTTLTRTQTRLPNRTPPVNITASIDYLGGITADAAGASIKALSSGGRTRLCAYEDPLEGVTVLVNDASERYACFQSCI